MEPKLRYLHMKTSFCNLIVRRALGFIPHLASASKIFVLEALTPDERERTLLERPISLETNIVCIPLFGTIPYLYEAGAFYLFIGFLHDSSVGGFLFSTRGLIRKLVDTQKLCVHSFWLGSI